MVIFSRYLLVLVTQQIDLQKHAKQRGDDMGHIEKHLVIQ